MHIASGLENTAHNLQENTHSIYTVETNILEICIISPIIGIFIFVHPRYQRLLFFA